MSSPNAALKIDNHVIERENADVFERVRLPLGDLERFDPQMIPLLRYWESLRRGGLLPAKSDIDPLSLKKFLGRIHFIDTHAAEPEQYCFTLWGSGCHLDGGQDYTRLRIGDYPSAAWRRAVTQDYQDVVKFGVPAYHLVSALHNYQRYEYSRLILPLSENGRQVTQLLVHVHKRPITEIKFL
ncbi:MAG TPA: PAS domain-containing protein [Alphaproteobacteria bacterium]|nr:PAS domain-containing protein [Alphaproteobacteria bacterium]